MNIIESLAIVALAGLIHASFQLSVSVLTLMSGHAIGTKRSHARVVRLATAYVIGAGVMTVLLLSFVSLVLLDIFSSNAPQLIWSIACGLLFGVGIAVWLFYYRKEAGTALWIPRQMATHLSDRSKATKHSSESFSLGLTSVIAEVIFIIAPIVISALVLIQLDPMWQLIGIGLYTVISMLSLGIVWALVGSGQSLSRIQKWRETNKKFLQFAAGSGLVVLAFYVSVVKIISAGIGG